MSLLKEINKLKLIRFLFISAFSFILNNLLNYIFIDLIEIKEYLSTAITYIILFISNFYLCKCFVFNVKNKSIKFIHSNFYVYGQQSKVKKLYSSKKIPDGKITQYLLNDYKLGILTVLMKRTFFKKKKFKIIQVSLELISQKN